MKGTLGTASEMMMDHDVDQLDSDRVQVQPLNQYYFNQLSDLEQNRTHQSNHYNPSSTLPANPLSQLMVHSQRHHQQRPVRQFDQTILGRQYAQSQIYPGSYSCHVGSSVGGNSNICNSNFTNQGRLPQQRPISSNVEVFDKENLPGDGPFPMLRNDEDWDLGKFQLSKSIFNNEGLNGNLHCRSHGTKPLSANVQESSQQQGGYFGFDRTNLVNPKAYSRQSGSQKSPMKFSYYNTSMVPKVEKLDLFATDSNSQAALPANVSPPTSIGSYLEAPSSSVATGGGGGPRPMMEFLDLNDDYWLEFAQ